MSILEGGRISSHLMWPTSAGLLVPRYQSVNYKWWHHKQNKREEQDIVMIISWFVAINILRQSPAKMPIYN
jgi:hypothetical protein